MSAVMEEEIKRWTARRKSQLVLEIIQGKTTVSEASRQFDLPLSEIESWVDEGKRGLENALRAKPEDVRGQYERQLKELQEAYGEAMLELRARKLWRPCWARTRPDGLDPASSPGKAKGRTRDLRRGKRLVIPGARFALTRATPGKSDSRMRDLQI